MSTSTVALTIEMPSLDASLSWNALESLVVGMSHEVPARALALALDDAQERLLQEACGPRWAPVRGLLAPFACPGCGAREDFARKGKRTRPRKLHTAAGTVELILWHVGCRGCGRNFAPLLVILGLSGKRRTDRLSLDLAELGTQMSFARAGRVDAELAGTSATAGQAHNAMADVAAPPSPPSRPAELELDYVGTIANAATVIASLHAGEKRLVFADSRRTVETLAARLRDRGTQTFVSHSSLSADERRQAEQAFVEARDCVIVSTSTLELGVDVGDLDRVLQVGAPRTVAALLQRLGRSGRRPGTTRSMLVLATDDDELLRAAGLLQLDAEGYVEPVVAPSRPLHLLAQQLLALCLHHGRVGRQTWTEGLGGLELGTVGEASRVTDWMLATGHVDSDSGMLFIGPQAERRYGHKHFLELLSVFTADPQFTIVNGQVEVGTVDPLMLTRKADGVRVLSLGGRAGQVTYVDWKRRRAFVEPTTRPGSSRWSGMAQPLSFALTDAIRRVVLGADLPGTSLTRRATQRIAAIRQEVAPTVDVTASLVRPHHGGQSRWWTWAGGRANSVLATALSQVEPGLVDELSQYDNRYVKLPGAATPAAVASAVARARDRFGADLAGAEPKSLRRGPQAAQVRRAAAAGPGEPHPGRALSRPRRRPAAATETGRVTALHLRSRRGARPCAAGQGGEHDGSKPHAPPAPAATDHLGRNQIGRVTWQSRPARQVGAEPDVDDHLRVDVHSARRRRGGHHHRQVLRQPDQYSPQLAHRSGPRGGP